MISTPRIAPASAAAIADRTTDLADLLIACVAAGASLGFRAPLTKPLAAAVFETLARRVADQTAMVLLALEGTELAGCIALMAEARETEPYLAELSKLMVHPAHRRRGIATALTLAAETQARSWGKTRLYLFTTDDGAAPAFYDRTFYRRAGLIPEGGGLPDGTIVDALIFTKSLRGTKP